MGEVRLEAMEMETIKEELVKIEVAIIGSRDADDTQYEAAMGLAEGLSRIGVYINTGGALRIDQAAMQGTIDGYLNVFLPWASYNAEIIPQHAKRTVYDSRIHTEWTISVQMFHPAPGRLTRGAFALHARNYGIIRPTKLVVAFPNETGGGGTGQGIRIAKHFGIPLIQHNKGSKIPPIQKLLGSAIGLIGQGRS